jgi:hypothetical protein
MNLHSDWKAILTRAWSMRFILLALALEGVAQYCQHALDMGATSNALQILAAMATAGAGIARVVSQKDLPDA